MISMWSILHAHQLAMIALAQSVAIAAAAAYRASEQAKTDRKRVAS